MELIRLLPKRVHRSKLQARLATALQAANWWLTCDHKSVADIMTPATVLCHSRSPALRLLTLNNPKQRNGVASPARAVMPKKAYLAQMLLTGAPINRRTKPW